MFREAIATRRDVLLHLEAKERKESRKGRYPDESKVHAREKSPIKRERNETSRSLRENQAKERVLEEWVRKESGM